MHRTAKHKRCLYQKISANFMSTFNYKSGFHLFILSLLLFVSTLRAIIHLLHFSIHFAEKWKKKSHSNTHKIKIIFFQIVEKKETEDVTNSNHPLNTDIVFSHENNWITKTLWKWRMARNTIEKEKYGANFSEN